MADPPSVPDAATGLEGLADWHRAHVEASSKAAGPCTARWCWIAEALLLRGDGGSVPIL